MTQAEEALKARVAQLEADLHAAESCLRSWHRQYLAVREAQFFRDEGEHERARLRAVRWIRCTRYTLHWLRAYLMPFRV